MLIQNYGLFWKQGGVDWGYQGRGAKGTLCGRYTKRLTDSEVDFREQKGVYVLYDDNFRIIYVGQAGSGNARLFVRLRKHKTDHLAQRWSRFSWFGILPVVNGIIDEEYDVPMPSVSNTLDHIEAILLAAAEPPLNLQRGRFGKEVQKYIQSREPNIGQSDDEDDEE